MKVFYRRLILNRQILYHFLHELSLYFCNIELKSEECNLKHYQQNHHHENMDGTIQASEMKSTYSRVYSVLNGESENGKEGTANKTSWEIPETSRLTVKGEMKVIPEIVNGNKGLEYQYSYKQQPTYWFPFR